MITDYSYNCHDKDLATLQVNYGLRGVVHLGPNQLSAELAIHYIANGNDTVYHFCSLESVTILKVSKRGHCSFQINSKLLLPKLQLHFIFGLFNKCILIIAFVCGSSSFV